MTRKKRQSISFSLCFEAISYIESLPKNQRSRFVDACILQGMADQKMPTDSRLDDLLADIQMITSVVEQSLEIYPASTPDIRRKFQYAELWEGETILTAWRHQWNRRAITTDEDERKEELAEAWLPMYKGDPNYANN